MQVRAINYPDGAKSQKYFCCDLAWERESLDLFLFLLLVFTFYYCIVSAFAGCECLLFNLQFGWRMSPPVLEDYMRSLVMLIFYICMLAMIVCNQRKRDVLKKLAET